MVKLLINLIYSGRGADSGLLFSPKYLHISFEGCVEHSINILKTNLQRHLDLFNYFPFDYPILLYRSGMYHPFLFIVFCETELTMSPHQENLPRIGESDAV